MDADHRCRTGIAVLNGGVLVSDAPVAGDDWIPRECRESELLGFRSRASGQWAAPWSGAARSSNQLLECRWDSWRNANGVQITCHEGCNLGARIAMLRWPILHVDERIADTFLHVTVGKAVRQLPRDPD